MRIEVDSALTSVVLSHMMSQSREARNAARNANGKFRAHPCDLCGKGCPMDYFSDSRCNDNGGWGITLHFRCADRLGKLTDEQYTELYNFVMGLRAW